MEINQFRNVDLVIDKANDNFIQKQFVSQGDLKGRTLTVQITDRGVIGEVPGLTLNLRWTNTASGLTDLSAFECIDQKNSLFRIEYPQNMLTPGTVRANILVIYQGKTTVSREFEITVANLAGQSTGVLATAEFSALVVALSDANRFYTQIANLQSTKADKTYMDDLISNIADGGPKGLFYSIASLKSTYPSGATGTFLVLDSSLTDGAHSFIWSNGEWKDLGVYQSPFYTASEIENIAKNGDNYFKNTLFVNQSYAPLKPYTTTSLSVANVRGRNWVRFTSADSDFSGGVYDFNNTNAFGFDRSPKEIAFDILPVKSGLYYAQITVSDGEMGAETIIKNFVRLNLLALDETRVTMKFTVPSNTFANPYYRIKFIHNKVGLTDKTTDFYIKPIYLVDKPAQIYSGSNEIVGKNSSVKPLANNVLTDSYFIGSDYFEAKNSTTDLTGWAGVRYVFSIDTDTDFTSSLVYELNTNVQLVGQSHTQLHVVFQYLDRNGVMLNQETVDRIDINNERMNAINVQFKPTTTSQTYYLAQLVLAVPNTGSNSILIDKETSVKKIKKKITKNGSIIGDSSSNFELTNHARTNGGKSNLYRKDGEQWTHVVGTMQESSGLFGLRYPVTDYTSITAASIAKIQLDMFSATQATYQMLVSYVDDNGTVLLFDTVFFDVASLASSRRRLETNYRIKSISGATRAYLNFGQISVGSVDFRVTNVNVVIQNPRDDSQKYVNGDYLKNYSLFGDIFCLQSQTRGANWLQVRSNTDTVVATPESIKFPIYLDRGTRDIKMVIPFDIWSINGDNYEMYIQYVNKDKIEIKRESLGKMVIGANQSWHNEYIYRIDATITDAEICYFIIKSGGTTYTHFFVKDVNIYPYMENATASKATDIATGASLPIFDLTGNKSGMSKDDRVDMDVIFTHNGIAKHVYADCKWQGDSSLQWPKKNYRLRFYNDEAHEEKLKIGWLPLDKDTNQINLKADWNDWTHCNNLLISNYLAELTNETSDYLPENLVTAYNNEQITGYPCIVYINGEYEGLYVASTKKGDDLMNSDEDNPLQAVVQSAERSSATCFKAPALIDGTDYEMATPDAPTDEIKTNFNALIDFVNNSSDTDFQAGIASKINLQSVANWIVGVQWFRLKDNVVKNICYQTVDGGQTWYMVSYDHDQAWGMFWDKSIWYDYTHYTLSDMVAEHRLVERLINLNMLNDELSRAKTAMLKIADYTQVINDYKTFITDVGASQYLANDERWTTQNGKDYFTTQKLFSYIRDRIKLAQTFFD